MGDLVYFNASTPVHVENIESAPSEHLYNTPYSSSLRVTKLWLLWLLWLWFINSRARNVSRTPSKACSRISADFCRRQLQSALNHLRSVGEFDTELGTITDNSYRITHTKIIRSNSGKSRRIKFINPRPAGTPLPPSQPRLSVSQNYHIYDQPYYKIQNR